MTSYQQTTYKVLSVLKLDAAVVTAKTLDKVAFKFWDALTQNQIPPIALANTILTLGDPNKADNPLKSNLIEKAFDLFCNAFTIEQVGSLLADVAPLTLKQFDSLDEGTRLRYQESKFKELLFPVFTVYVTGKGKRSLTEVMKAAQYNAETTTSEPKGIISYQGLTQYGLFIKLNKPTKTPPFNFKAPIAHFDTGKLANAFEAPDTHEHAAIIKDWRDWVGDPDATLESYLEKTDGFSMNYDHYARDGKRQFSAVTNIDWRNSLTYEGALAARPTLESVVRDTLSQPLEKHPETLNDFLTTLFDKDEIGQDIVKFLLEDSDFVAEFAALSKNFKVLGYEAFMDQNIDALAAMITRLVINRTTHSADRDMADKERRSEALTFLKMVFDAHVASRVKRNVSIAFTFDGEASKTYEDIMGTEYTPLWNKDSLDAIKCASHPVIDEGGVTSRYFRIDATAQVLTGRAALA